MKAAIGIGPVTYTKQFIIFSSKIPRKKAGRKRMWRYLDRIR